MPREAGNPLNRESRQVDHFDRTCRATASRGSTTDDSHSNSLGSEIIGKRKLIPSLVSASRRRFLTHIGMFGLISCAPIGISNAIAEPTVAEVKIETNTTDLMRVRMEMDVKGNVEVPNDPLVSRKKKLTLPMTSKAVLDYEERYRRPSGADRSSEIMAIERYYHEANTESTVNRSTTKMQLRESVRQTQVRRDSLPEAIYSVDDYFTNEELGLLRVPVASSAVDMLLPIGKATLGMRYKPATSSLASVLNLSHVQKSAVVAKVTEILDDQVRFELNGRLEASVDGVPTTLKIIGKFTYDQKMRSTSWIAIAIHETREIGKAEPGFDVVATVKMIRQPLAKPVALPVKPAAMAIEEPTPADRLYVDLRSQGVGVSMMMDRHWRVMADLNGNAMLRMTENDRSIAQCNVRELARLKEGEHLTMEAFEQNVRSMFGKQIEDVLQADQRLSASGLRVLRVVAQGSVQGVPIQWIVTHFSDDSGRRVLATFTMESQNIESFMGSDAQFVDSLRFNEMPADSDQIEGPSGDQKPSNTKDVARTNQVKQRRIAENEVQSASQLR